MRPAAENASPIKDVHEQNRAAAWAELPRERLLPRVWPKQVRKYWTIIITIKAGILFSCDSIAERNVYRGRCD